MAFISTLEIKTEKRNQIIDITSGVSKLLSESGLQDGIVLVYVPHTTAAVTINENTDRDVAEDIIEAMERLVPRKAGYRHIEGNSDAHIKASLVGSSVTVVVSGGRLTLGTWQGILFCEFDGPRKRIVWISTLQCG